MEARLAGVVSPAAAGQLDEGFHHVAVPESSAGVSILHDNWNAAGKRTGRTMFSTAEGQ
jgi:hypothetical protein